MRSLRPYLINLLLLATAFVLSLAAGTVEVPLPALVQMLLAWIPGFSLSADIPATYALVLYQIRLPHAILVMLTGAALASSGAAYQGLFRNPLADPYLIGVASGAGLGAVIGMAVQWPTVWLEMYAIPILAFVGASLTVAVVYFLARVGGTVPTTTLILSGVAVSAFTSALTTFLMLGSHEELRRAFSWILGGSFMSGWQPVLGMLPYCLLGMAILALSGHTLNVLQFGDDQAQSLGLAVEKRKAGLILAASLTTASAIAFSGSIGFVGLIVPHLVRMIWGPDYRRLMTLSILGGGSLLLLADLLARTLLAPQVLPVGIITAMAGAPFFLWVLRATKNQAYF